MVIFATKPNRWVVICNKITYEWECQTPSDLWGGLCNYPFFKVGLDRLCCIARLYIQSLISTGSMLNTELTLTKLFSIICNKLFTLS
jgi:hypothetical protein